MTINFTTRSKQMISSVPRLLGRIKTAAPTTTADAAPLTAAQQAAKKAEILGRRGAGTTTASQTGSGFKDYVGGSQNKMTTNPDGSTTMNKLQRESVGFSNFLGIDL